MADLTLSTDAGAVRARIDGPRNASVVMVLAHGAGAGMDSDFMAHIASGLSARGARVVRFDFPYITQGRRSPDRAPVLETVFAQVVENLSDERRGRRMIAGGKSLGGRIASQAAATGMSVDGLLFLGYPLHPPGKPERIRDAHLGTVAAPMLFVTGTRDPFCPLATLEPVLRRLGSPAALAVIDGGDHSFKVPKSSGRTTQEAWDEVVAVAAEWATEGAGAER